MTTRLRVTAQAENDIADAARWYEEKRRGLGVDFFHKVDEILGRILEAPRSFPQVCPGVWRARLKRFPYGVYFTISRSAVIAFAVLHLHRNPNTWKRGL